MSAQNSNSKNEAHIGEDSSPAVAVTSGSVATRKTRSSGLKVDAISAKLAALRNGGLRK